MAMGVPVISSDIAAGGVDALPGQHILTANDKAGYADNAIRVLENPDFRMKLAHAARERVLTNHNWKISMKMLDELVESL
jgi:glycosyltransferase involved in cell wall biosynthesis